MITIRMITKITIIRTTIVATIGARELFVSLGKPIQIPIVASTYSCYGIGLSLTYG